MGATTIRALSILLAAFLPAGCVLDMDPAEMLPPDGQAADIPDDTDVLDMPFEPDEPLQDSAPEADEPADGRDAPDYSELPDIIDVPIEETPPPSGVGEACETNADCTPFSELDPQCLDSFTGVYDLPGGYCTAQCTDPADCGSGADCVSLLISNFCMRACTETAQCRMDDGYECREIPFFGGDTYCLPSSW